MPKERKSKTLNYAKCSQCRRDRQRCTPADRHWPERCDRCKQYDFTCSPNYTKSNDPSVPKCTRCKSDGQACVRRDGAQEGPCERCVKDSGPVLEESPPASGEVVVTEEHVQAGLALVSVNQKIKIRDSMELLREMDFLQYLLAFRSDIMNLEWDDWFQHGEKFYLSKDWSGRLYWVRRWATTKLAALTAEIRREINSHLANGRAIEAQLLSSRLYLDHYEELSGDRFLNVGIESCKQTIDTDLKLNLVFLAMSKQERLVQKLATESEKGRLFDGSDWRAAIEKLMVVYKKIVDFMPTALASVDFHLTIQSGMAPQSVWESRFFSPLHRACAARHMRVVERVLEEWPEAINSENLSEETPLHVATRSNHDEVAKLLLARGASKTAQDGRGRLPFMWAYMNKNHILARELVPQVLHPESYFGTFSIADMNGTQRSVKMNILHILAYMNLVSELNAVLGAGMDVDSTLAHTIPASEESEGLVSFTLTAMAVATWRRNADIVKLLLDHGANPDLQIERSFFLPHAESLGDVQGKTCLIYAVENGWRAGIELLVSRGAKIGHALELMLTPSGDRDVFMSLVKSTHGHIPSKALPIAVSCGYLEVVEYLLQQGRRPVSDQYVGVPALHRSILAQNIPIFELLLKHLGKDEVDLRDSAGRTALHCTFRVGALDAQAHFIKGLITHGADPHLKFRDRSFYSVIAETTFLETLYGELFPWFILPQQRIPV